MRTILLGLFIIGLVLSGNDNGGMGLGNVGDNNGGSGSDYGDNSNSGSDQNNNGGSGSDYGNNSNSGSNQNNNGGSGSGSGSDYGDNSNSGSGQNNNNGGSGSGYGNDSNSGSNQNNNGGSGSDYGDNSNSGSNQNNNGSGSGQNNNGGSGSGYGNNSNSGSNQNNNGSGSDNSNSNHNGDSGSDNGSNYKTLSLSSNQIAGNFFQQCFGEVHPIFESKQDQSNVMSEWVRKWFTDNAVIQIQNTVFSGCNDFDTFTAAWLTNYQTFRLTVTEAISVNSTTWDYHAFGMVCAHLSCGCQFLANVHLSVKLDNDKICTFLMDWNMDDFVQQCSNDGYDITDIKNWLSNIST